MTIIDRIVHKITGALNPVVESEVGHGLLEVECVIRKADGTLKSKETSVRPVTFVRHGNQITKIEDIETRPNLPLCLASPLAGPFVFGVTVVNDGLEYLARYCTQSTVGYFAWMALGTGSTAEAISQTALVAEITDADAARALATVSYEASYKAVWQKTFSFTMAHAIYECGIFNQLAVGGKMLMRHVFSAVKNVENGETMQLTMKLTFSR